MVIILKNNGSANINRDLISYCSEFNSLNLLNPTFCGNLLIFSGFGDILNLVPLAESVVKLTAVCMQCFKDASFTKRTCEGTEVS